MQQPVKEKQTRAMAALTDTELVACARHGEALAFEVIVRRHNRLLFRAARGLVNDDATAQDMVQDAYINAFTHLEAFRGDASLRTWLTRIVINQSLSHLRRQRPAISLSQDDMALPSAWAEEDDMPTSLTDPNTPDAAADNLQMKALLESAITRLPETYRSVFMLRDVEGMSVEDTAHCLDVSQEVVRTRLVRARAQLRQRLATQLQAQAGSTFEFAGQRCDSVTQYVMDELHRRGLIRLTDTRK